MATFGNSKCDCGQNKDTCDLSCWNRPSTPANRNDIVWFECDDRGERLLKNNPNNRVLVLTDVTFRIDYAKYIQNGRLVTANENVIRFTFFD